MYSNFFGGKLCLHVSGGIISEYNEDQDRNYVLMEINDYKFKEIEIYNKTTNKKVTTGTTRSSNKKYIYTVIYEPIDSTLGLQTYSREKSYSNMIFARLDSILNKEISVGIYESEDTIIFVDEKIGLENTLASNKVEANIIKGFGYFLYLASLLLIIRLPITIFYGRDGEE